MNIYAMKRFWFKTLWWALAVSGLGAGMLVGVKQVQAYQGSSISATVIYSEPINVRGGPSTVYYPIIGRLSPGDVVPALGVSPGREWVQITYPPTGTTGWVYAIYVNISGGELLVVEAPATATPPVTATIDATLAAQFNVYPTPSRLPTFTPPPPLNIPQYSDEPVQSRGGALGYVALGLLALGVLGLIVSLILRK
jgi:hypothetical protein